MRCAYKWRVKIAINGKEAKNKKGEKHECVFRLVLVEGTTMQLSCPSVYA
jgi:hypothetical protein